MLDFQGFYLIAGGSGFVYGTGGSLSSGKPANLGKMWVRREPAGNSLWV